MRCYNLTMSKQHVFYRDLSDKEKENLSAFRRELRQIRLEKKNLEKNRRKEYERQLKEIEIGTGRKPLDEEHKQRIRDGMLLYKSSLKNKQGVLVMKLTKEEKKAIDTAIKNVIKRRGKK